MIAVLQSYFACFNPRPLLLTGESWAGVTPFQEEGEFQSTPVIANGRIAGRHAQRRRSNRFNPRPLLLTGESRGPGSVINFPLLFQSTPVIANGRINQPNDQMVFMEKFQSTPVIANGRIVCERGRDFGVKMFQSTPVIANGRISWPTAWRASRVRFNPRPLLLTGESHPARLSGRASGVSIHARYC